VAHFDDADAGKREGGCICGHKLKYWEKRNVVPALAGTHNLLSRGIVHGFTPAWG
jgi:hypothetical protein